MSTRINPNISNQKARGALMLAVLASIILWFTPGAQMVLYPIRIFVTLVHEGGHAVATIATGGGVDSIAIHQNANGETLSRGGVFFVICMSGYLGATLFGACALLMSRRKQAGKRGLLIMGALVALVTGLWVHPLPHPFGFVMGLVITALLLTGARLLPERAAAFVLSFLAVQLCLNSIFDLRDLLWLTTNTNSANDAVFMAREFGLTPWFWAISWAIGAATILAFSLRAYWKGTR